MTLSTMQEILILLEDEKTIPLYRLNRWGRPARGVLAKLKNLKWAEKQIKEKEIYYSITEVGEAYFDNVLTILKLSKWDKKWRILMFDIPENKRSQRDKLRRALDDLGMGILQASVWVSSKDVKDKIDKVAESLNLQSNIKYFEVESSPNLDQQIIEKAWKIEELNLAFERFIKEAERVLKGMGKGNGDRFNAKKLIFQYALILKKDPSLPLEFVKQNELRGRAREIYLRLRKYIN